MAATINTIWYTNYGNGTSTGYYALTQWATGAAKTVGQIIRQLATPSIGNERCFICIVAGTTHASTEPTWTVTKGAKTTDNTVTWQECTGQAAVNGDATNPPLSSGQRSQAVTLGATIQNNAGTFLFICSTAGTAGAGEPTYNTTTGNTTTDSGVTWTCIGAAGANGTGAFGKWAAPFARSATTFGSTWATAGDTEYVSSISAETAASGISNISTAVNGSLVSKVLCIANTGGIPPAAADFTTGATVTQTNNFGQLGTQGVFFVDGVTFNSTAGATSPTFGAGTNNYSRVRNAALNMTGGTFATAANFGSTGTTRTVLENVTIQLSGTGTTSGIGVNGNFVWRDTPSALSKFTGLWPTYLFTTGSSAATAYVENVDLSAFAGTAYLGNSEGATKWVFNKCKFAASASVPIYLQSATTGLHSGFNVDLIDCDSAGATYRHERWNYQGSQVVSITGVRTTGATNGTTAYSWFITTTANSSWGAPFECLPMAIWNTVTAADVTVTLHGAYNGTALPTNAEIWFDIAHFGTSSSTLGTRVTAGTTGFATTSASHTADTSAAWNSAATARANSTAYVLNDLRSVSSAAAGQLYICTTAGTSSGSLPGGYASCSDGSSVTDGTAVFRALVRFSMAVTLTGPQPQSAGYLNCSVKVAKLSSIYLVDPLPVLS